jgi:hypothetical protein
MGICVSIFRAEYESTQNVFRNVRRLTIVNVPGPFEPTDEAPAACLVRGARAGIVRVVPAKLAASGQWTPDTHNHMVMFGGSYVATSDSRLTAAIEAIIGSAFYGAVALHDRVEA